ncbi:MAG: hypothetical protein ACTSYC_02750 [Promethearchaeota archaeon]
MTFLKLEEIKDIKNLPELVKQEWHNAVEYKKRGKPPRLFKSEPMFKGPNPDYLILINIGRGSKRLTCEGYIYNGNFPSQSGQGTIYVTPDFKYHIIGDDLLYGRTEPEKSMDLPKRRENIPWKPNEPFIIKDYYLKNGQRYYALYKVPVELYTLIEITDSRILINNFETYSSYSNKIVLIDEIPLAILVQELINLCDILWRFIFSEETNFQKNPEKVKSLLPYKNEIFWLANNLVPFFQYGIISKEHYPYTLLSLEACLDALQIQYDFGIYTSFGYHDPR